MASFLLEPSPDGVIVRTLLIQTPAESGIVSAQLRLSINEAIRRAIPLLRKVGAVPEAMHRFPDGFVLKEPRRPGRKGHSDLYLSALASRYVRKTMAGNRRAVAELAAEMHLSVETVRGLLVDARNRELLTRPPAGKAGGRLTEKALRLLGQLPEQQRPKKASKRERSK